MGWPFAVELFGSHVGRLADQLAHQRHSGVAGLAGQPEVNQLEPPVVQDHHVGRPDVAVQDVLGVYRVYRIGQLVQNADGFFQRQGPRSRIWRRGWP